jgi:endonuclease/exonuclease/phosphatase family metal-dependent hydrolase
VLLLLLSCAEPPVAPFAGSFEVLSYNVHGLPEAITGDDTSARMEAIAPLLGAFDLIGLQEDWMEENHAVLAAAVDLPTYDRFNTPSDDQKAYGAGLSTWASLPATAVLHTTFTDCHGVFDDGSDCLASKGFAALRLQLPDGRDFDLYNSHLEAGSGEGDDPARAAQVDQLVAAMEGWSAGRAVVFVGDTNLSGDSAVDQAEVERWCAATGLQDACDLLGCPEPGRIDRVLLRDGGGVALEALDWRVEEGFVDAAGAPLSDHDPIGLTLGVGG